MRCPYCAEKIQRKAVVCMYCGRDLPPKQQTNPRKIQAVAIIILGLIGLCILITIIGSAIQNAEIARDPVAATINAMSTATQRAIPTPIKTDFPTRTPLPTSTSVQDGAIQILMGIVGLTKEEATTAFEQMKAVGYSQLSKLEFDQEIPPLKFYLAEAGYTRKTILSFEGSELVGINQGGDRQLYDRDAGGVIDNIQNYVLSDKDKGTFIILAKEFVKNSLKAPSTAKFPNSIFEMNEWRIGRNHDVITVISWVDAQNSFGAMIRSNFAVQISYSSTDLLYLLLDGKIMYGYEH